MSSTGLSTLKTNTQIDHFTTLRLHSQLPPLLKFAREKGLRVLYLGNGSNVIFKSRVRNTLVIANELPVTFDAVEGDIFRVSAAMPLLRFLQLCFRLQRNAPYYLASVPGTVGGAVAMNAGRGKIFRKSIFDFVHSIQVIDETGSKRMSKKEISYSYRTTPFSGTGNAFISEVYFCLPGSLTHKNPIQERLRQVRLSQDNGKPSCGSIFKKRARILCWLLKGTQNGGATYSTKTLNWITSVPGGSPEEVIALIEKGKAMHRKFRLSAVEEVIIVD